MKIGCIKIEPNDDGTYQVEVRSSYDMPMSDSKELKYSAKTLEEVIEKVKEAETEFKIEKPKRKSDKSIKTFLMADEE